MSTSSSEGAPLGWQRLGPPLTAAVPVSVFSLAALAIPLTAAQILELSPDQTGAWLLALYGIPTLLRVLLTMVSRQPLLVAWHTGVVVFLAPLAAEIPYADLRGATLVGGLIVLTLGALGLTARVARLVPVPVVHGIVAANALPFVVGIFDALGDERVLIGATLLAYFVARRGLEPRLPAILPALLVGLAAAGLTGRLGGLPSGWAPPPLVVAPPGFSLAAIVTVVPVFVALTAFHANLTYGVYLRGQGYRPPARLLDVVTGGGSALGAFLGPTPICMGSAVVALVAGPEAGDRAVRHWAVHASMPAFLLIALGAGVAADLPAIVPMALLLAIAGLALIGVLGHALGEITRGPVRLGPLFAFVVAGSDLTLLGVGPTFWALVLGTGVALLLEGAALRELEAARGA